nr:hypothetical protein CFP56_09849 [Quercus suber]
MRQSGSQRTLSEVWLGSQYTFAFSSASRASTPRKAQHCSYDQFGPCSLFYRQVGGTFFYQSRSQLRDTKAYAWQDRVKPSSVIEAARNNSTTTPHDLYVQKIGILTLTALPAKAPRGDLPHCTKALASHRSRSDRDLKAGCW